MLKKRVFYIVFILITIVSVLGCEQINKGEATVEITNKLTKEEAERIHASTFEAAVELNENSDIDSMLLRKTDEQGESLVITDLKEDSNYDLPSPNFIEICGGDATGTTLPYPYDTIDYYITNIVIYNGKRDIFGLKIGDDISMVQPTMDNWKYTPVELKQHEIDYYDQEGLNVLKYSKYDITVYFYTAKNSSMITEIYIDVTDCNEPSEDPHVIY